MFGDQLYGQSRQSIGGRPAEHTPEDRRSIPVEIARGEQRDIVEEVARNISQAFQFDRHNREDAVVDLKFLAGDQWPEYARAARVNRPMLTINRLPQFLHQVTNSIRQNAPVLKVTPVGGKQDPNISKIYDGIINDIQYRCSAKHVYATAAYHAAACGIGHWRVITRYVSDESFDQELAIELIPYPLAVYWDPASVKPDRSDAMWCVVIDLVPRETFKQKYPGALQVSVPELRANNFASGLFWTTQDYILVAEYWCKRPMDRTLLAFQSGATIDVTGLGMEQLTQIQLQNGQPMAKRVVKSHFVEQSVVTGAEVLSGPVKWMGRHIPIIPVVGDEIPLERITIRHGLIRHARDPQQLYNFYRSASAEAIALAPKSPWLVTDAQIAKHRADWNNANTQNKPYLRYTPDPNAPQSAPARIAPPPVPEALWREGAMASEDLKATTGIYDAALGARSNETSGVAIKRRDQQADTANFHYMDNLTRSLEHSGRILIDLIPKVYDNERVVRMVGDDGAEQFAPINQVLYAHDGEPVMVNDLSVGRYDIRVVIGPNYATKRLEAAQAMSELMHAMPPEAAMVLGYTAVKNMDIPDGEAVSNMLKAMIPPQILADPNTPPPPPPDPLADPTIRAEVIAKLAAAQKAVADANKVEIETMATFGQMMPPMQPPLPNINELLGQQMMPPMPPPANDPMDGFMPNGGPGPMPPMPSEPPLAPLAPGEQGMQFPDQQFPPA